jgi:aspartyl protease family protein
LAKRPAQGRKQAVGHVYAEARVFWRRSKTVRFLVDTGATYAIVPPSLARAVGVPPARTTFTVKLADGATHRLRACTMGIELCGREAPMTALLLPKAEPLLGVETLEGLGLRVNPSSGKLEPTRAHGVLAVGVRPATHRRRASPRRR